MAITALVRIVAARQVFSNLKNIGSPPSFVDFNHNCPTGIKQTRLAVGCQERVKEIEREQKQSYYGK
jgi:hypothetical protein